jgi:predicted outer membrane protein
MQQSRFLVPVEIEVEAASSAEAESEVLDLIRYANSVSNDQGKFKGFRLHETSDTIKVG